MVSRVSFLMSGFILAVLKDVGKRPEVREELIIEVRNGRMSLEAAWWSEEWIGSRRQAVVCFNVTILLTSSRREG